MIAKNIFLLGAMAFILSACGGSEDTTAPEASPSSSNEATPQPISSNLNLTGVTASNQSTKFKVSGVSTSSRAFVSDVVANSQADIIFAQKNEVVQGNVTFSLAVSDPDGIATVSLVLPSVDKSIALCSELCGLSFEQSIIGFNPYFYGEKAGDLRLEIWITDNLNNQVLADATTFSWQPHQIEGVTAQRNDQSIDLSWQANSDLNRYNVYLATQAGVTPENINTLENGQQFLSLSNSAFSFDGSLVDKSYQILITGIDGSGESGFAEAINIAPIGGELNFAPNAQPDQFQINEDESLQGNVVANDTDQYMGELRINLDALVQPQHGTLNINESGEFNYTPTANFNGEDAFSYQVVNELDMTDIAVVEIVVNPINDAPIALDNSYSIPLDGNLNIASPGLLANDSDIDLDSLTVDTSPITEPEKGRLTLRADGSFEYLGEVDMRGEDSFQYRIVDSQGEQAIANVVIIGVAENMPPIATNDSYSLSEDSTLVVEAIAGLLKNDTDPNNDNFFVDENFIVAPVHGQLLLATDGSFTYIPDANFFGVDQFQYQIIDSQGATAQASVTLTINSEADNPIAQNDEYLFRPNKLLEVNVESGLLVNDINIESGDLYVNTVPVVAVKNGELNLNTDGSFTYQPNQNFVGVDSFTYLVSNEQGLAASAQVILSKSGVNTLPSANNDTFTLNEDSPATLLDVLANDNDLDGDVISISRIENTIGQAVIVDKKIEFTPPVNFNGDITLTYSITDGNTLESTNANDTTATVTITVIPVNDAPIANADTATMAEDAAPLLINVLANDTDIDGDTLTITSAATDLGSVLIIGNQLQYTPAINSYGAATVLYSVSDENQGTASANLSITITAVNDAPIANADTATMAEDAAPLLINVLANDTDIDGDTLTITSATADLGSVFIIGNQLQYTPAVNSNGVAAVLYSVSDGNQGTASANLSITITAVNDAPTASNQTFSVSENSTDGDVVGTIVASDIENENLSYTLVSGDIGLFNINSSSGLLTANGPSPFNYENATQHLITVAVTDDGTPNETTSINITVNVTNADDYLIPVESETFGRPVTGELELSSVFSNGEFNDSIELNNNLYFVGFSQNTDQDIVIASYTNNGAANNAFDEDGIKILDLGHDEKATAIISGGGDLFIAFSSFDGTNTEACLLKMSVTGVISNTSGDNNSGIHCTKMASTLVINDLEFSDNKIQAVGKQFNGNDDDSLWIKYDISTLAYEASSPKIKDVSGQQRDDEAFAIKNFNGSDLMVVGSVTSANGDKDALIRYLISDGENNGNFNDYNALSIDLSGNNTDDELFALGGLNTADFTAFVGGYTTRHSGEKEAVVLAIDKKGDLVTSIGNHGIAVYDIDGNTGAGNGGAEITGVKYEPINNQITLSGTTGKGETEKLFSTRILATDGALDDTYGINIISDINGKQIANAATIDLNDTLWVSGISDDSSSQPFIVAIDNHAALFTGLAGSGYLTLSNLGTDSNDQSKQVIQLSHGTHAGKYIIASTAQQGSVIKLVLTRLTVAGLLDTSFSESGHRQIAIDLSTSNFALIEQNDGKLIIAGSRKTENNEEGFVARVDQNGYFDTDFATEGIYATTAVTTQKLNLTDAALDSDNDIIAVGSLTVADTPSSFVMKLTPEGSLESDFGNNGKIIGTAFQSYKTVYIDNSDKIFIGGKVVSGSDSQILAVKLSVDGEREFSYIDSVMSLDNDDRIVKIFADTLNNLYLIGNETNTPNQAVIVKLSSAGIKETSFAEGGAGQYILTQTGDTKVKDAALDSMGNIVLSGMGNNKGVLARILSNGVLDGTFGHNGVGFYKAEQCANEQIFTSMILQSDTQVIVSSTCNNGTSNNISASKFNFYVDGVTP
ncbi:Ig-like domain-containing protein [Pseudoalteromonas sp. SCSIO 43210]